MAVMNYIIWNIDPEIFTIPIPFLHNNLTLRWYGVLFALGFIISQQILYYIYKKEGKPEKDVDTLTIYMVIATIVGARLGHVIFYQPEIIWTNPLGIFLPFEFKPEFHFTGLQGLASHGGAIGILVAIWIYSRKKKPGQNYFQVLDRIVILVALTGALIRLGNFFNSEIIGKPTHSNYGIVFAHNITEALEKSDAVEEVSYVKVDSVSGESGIKLTKILVDLNLDSMAEQGDYKNIAENILHYRGSMEQVDPVSLYSTRPIKNDKGSYSSIIYTNPVPRHPAQLYESFSCLLLFILLFWMWHREKENLSPGRLFAIFLIGCFTLRFFFEFLKENQEDFENAMALNMGQILSIPLILAGIAILFLRNRKKTS